MTLLPTPVAPQCEAFLSQLASVGVLVGDFYLLLGVPWPARPLQPGVELGAMKRCYLNAGQLALERPELAYCEGFATKVGLFPMHHAWCISPEGQVIDVTWPYDAANEYWGVVLSEKFLLEHRLATQQWDVLGDRLPLAIQESHPDTYLHDQWRPGQAQINQFWARIRASHTGPA